EQEQDREHERELDERRTALVPFARSARKPSHSYLHIAGTRHRCGERDTCRWGYGPYGPSSSGTAALRSAAAVAVAVVGVRVGGGVRVRLAVGVPGRAGPTVAVPVARAHGRPGSVGVPRLPHALRGVARWPTGAVAVAVGGVGRGTGAAARVGRG